MSKGQTQVPHSLQCFLEDNGKDREGIQGTIFVHPQVLIDTAFHRGFKQKVLGIHRSSDISKNP